MPPAGRQSWAALLAQRAVTARLVALTCAPAGRLRQPEDRDAAKLVCGWRALCREIKATLDGCLQGYVKVRWTCNGGFTPPPDNVINLVQAVLLDADPQDWFARDRIQHLRRFPLVWLGIRGVLPEDNVDTFAEFRKELADDLAWHGSLRHLRLVNAHSSLVATVLRQAARRAVEVDFRDDYGFLRMLHLDPLTKDDATRAAASVSVASLRYRDLGDAKLVTRNLREVRVRNIDRGDFRPLPNTYTALTSSSRLCRVELFFVGTPVAPEAVEAEIIVAAARAFAGCASLKHFGVRAELLRLDIDQWPEFAEEFAKALLQMQSLRSVQLEIGHKVGADLLNLVLGGSPYTADEISTLLVGPLVRCLAAGLPPNARTRVNGSLIDVATVPHSRLLDAVACGTPASAREASVSGRRVRLRGASILIDPATAV